MRRAALFPIVLAIGLSGCAPTQPPAPYSLVLGPPPAPYSLAPRLPYAACGDMTTLRANLTGNRDPSPQSDALLWSLGVRCIGEAYPGVVCARY
jgi:hypothetical protein